MMGVLWPTLCFILLAQVVAIREFTTIKDPLEESSGPLEERNYGKGNLLCLCASIIVNS